MITHQHLQGKLSRAVRIVEFPQDSVPLLFSPGHFESHALRERPLLVGGPGGFALLGGGDGPFKVALHNVMVRHQNVQLLGVGLEAFVLLRGLFDQGDGLGEQVGALGGTNSQVDG